MPRRTVAGMTARLPWWQDIVGWSAENYRLAGQATRVNTDHGRGWLQVYADDAGDAWTVVTAYAEIPVCGRGRPSPIGTPGRCVMPPGHLETPHVWAYKHGDIVVSLARRRRLGSIR